jgi:hypothetical protein
MTSIQVRRGILAAASLAAASLAGCGGSDGSTVPTPGTISDGDSIFGLRNPSIFEQREFHAGLR